MRHGCPPSCAPVRIAEATGQRAISIRSCRYSVMIEVQRDFRLWRFGGATGLDPAISGKKGNAGVIGSDSACNATAGVALWKVNRYHVTAFHPASPEPSPVRVRLSFPHDRGRGLHGVSSPTD